MAIFEGLTPQQVDMLSPFMQEVHLEKDVIVFEQGQPADCLYILLEGEVEVWYKPYDGPPLIVTRILPGGVFGWSAALQREAYTSAALPVVDGLAYRMHGSRLRELCVRYPDIGEIFLDRLAGVIAERLRNTHSSILNMLSQGMNLNGCGSK